MKNISLLSILTTLLLSFTVFAEENNPCLHNNTGLCGVPLKPENLQSLTLSYPVPTADAPADVRSLVRSAVNSKLDSKTLLCKICGEEIKCKIDIINIIISTGQAVYTSKWTATGNVYLRCSSHVENGIPSTRTVPFTIKFEETDDDDNDCSSGHSHDWSDWSYHCELESPSQESYSIFNTDTVLRSFIKAKANDRVKDKSYKSKICNICQKERKENYSHSADWLCGYYSPYYHIHNTETEMTPPVTNGKHLYCVRMDSGNCTEEFAVIPVWIQQTVKSIEVNNAEEYNSSGLELPALPDSEPAPGATYIARVYDQEKNNGVKLKAIANFGDWTANNVSWEYYPHSPYDNRPYIYRPDTNKSDEIEFRATSPGTYVVVARCNYGDDENLPAQAKAVTIVVLDAAITVNFQNPDDETLTCQPCNPSSKIFVINANTHGLNANQKLKIEIKKPDDEELYEAYLAVRLADGTIKSVPFPIKGSEGANLLNVNGSWYGELVVKPLVQAEEGESVETYTVKASFEDATLSDLSDSLDCKVIWDECADGSCQTGTGGAGIRKGGRSKRIIGTNVTARPSSVYGNFTLGKNSSGKVSGSFGFSSENLSLTSLSDSFKVQTVNGTICGKDAQGRVVWTKNGKTASVIDYTDTSISGSNVLTQVRVRQFFNSDTSAETAPSAPSSLVSDATFTLNVSGNTANGISVSNTTYNGTLSQTESWSFSRPEVLLSSWGLNYSGYDCWQENQSGTITVSGEKYVTSGGNTYRYSFNAVGTSTALAKVTSQIEQLFSWGYSTISETDGNKTTTCTYNSGEYEQLASVKNPDGSRTSYTYDNEGNIATETDVTGTLTKVTTYTRSAIAADNIRTVTVESKIDGTVVSKRSYQEIIGVSAESEDAPASYTLNSIQYNGTQTFTTATTYTKRTNLHGNKVYSVTKRTNVNGTETRYSYVISGDTEITTTENGVFNNDSLTLGTRQTSTVNRDGATLSTASFFVDSANNINVQTASTVNSNFDEFGRARTTTYLDGSTVTRTYGCCGVATETDRDGVTTTYAYDEFKRVSHTVRDGITTLYSYDALGNQTSVTIKGRNDGEITTSKTYNNGELATSTDALGNVTSYTQSYSTSGNNTTYTETVTNPDNSTQITTSVNGQQTSVSGTAVREQTISYGVNWQKIMPQNQTVYTDMMGRNFKTVYADNTYSINYYNNKNQGIKSVTPAGRVTLVEYDALGRQVKQAIDMNGNDIIDDADLVTSVTYSYGTQNGKTVSITTQTRSQGSNSAVISVKKQSIDGLENWQTNLNGLTTHIKLERLGGGNIRQTVTNPDGTKVVTNSNNGKVITVQSIGADNSSGITVAYTYDEFNRQAGMTQTESGTTFTTSTMTYNAAGQPLTQTVNGRTTSIVYNVVNRIRTITLPGDRTVTEVYHPTGELQRVSGADTYTQEWTYDPVWGQKATLTTYKDSDTPQVTTWIYNNRGNLASKKYPNNNGPSYTYNADGNLLTRTWERNIITSYTYDNAGRLLTQSYSDNTPGITATYDYLDRIVSLTDASGTRNFTYNAQHLLVNETIPYIMNLQSSFTYDNFGRRTLRTLQMNNTTIASAGRSYDTFGRIASVSNGTDTLSYTYRPGGQLSLAGWTNGQNSAMSNQSYEYDQYNRLTGIKLNNVNEVSYTLNAKDQRTAATYANAGLWNFTYDDKGQVTGANGSSKSYTYSYDGIGNRLTANENSTITNYTSNLLNQYTLINNTAPEYDADGNMTTSGNGWVYTYNGENRITQATKGSTTVTMAYDYAGRRISKTVSVSGVIQNSYKYAYDGFKLIAVYNNNDLVMTFTWQPESLGMDVPVSMTYAGATYYYVTDGNKNVTALLDANGNRVAEYVYGPFGQTVSATGAMAQINPFRFSSEFHDDETGLVYYNYRYYSPELGRWTKRDPIEEDGGVNMYSINNNNPILSWDINGLRCCIGEKKFIEVQVFISEINPSNLSYLKKWSPDIDGAIGDAIMGTFVDVLKEQVKDLKGATRNLMKNALLDIAKDFGIKMTDKVMNKIASDFVSNLLHSTSIWTRVHYKECEKKFFITSFQDKTTRWRQCSLGGALGLYDNAQQAIKDVEKCKEAHEYSWREK